MKIKSRYKCYLHSFLIYIFNKKNIHRNLISKVIIIYIYILKKKKKKRKFLLISNLINRELYKLIIHQLHQSLTPPYSASPPISIYLRIQYINNIK